MILSKSHIIRFRKSQGVTTSCYFSKFNQDSRIFFVLSIYITKIINNPCTF
ncbi:hypothetical protein Hanom_Chr04g00332931 [Helianthus anomalus]